MSTGRANRKSSDTTQVGHTHTSETFDISYQRWIHKQMEKRALEYSDVDKTSIYCATWNVNAKTLPGVADLRSWLLPEDAVAPDIYAIGLQEMVDLNVVNVVMKSSTSDDTAAVWMNSLITTLKEIGSYQTVVEKHMVGLFFVVFVKDSFIRCISDVKYSLTYTGSYGVTGNKGAVCIRMLIHDSPVCFVCAHFHANRDNVQARNLDFQSIVDNHMFVVVDNPNTKTREVPETVFLKSLEAPEEPSTSGKTQTSAAANAVQSMGILSHEHVFWFGDLNYRIGDEVDITDVFDRLEKDTWLSLRVNDQLNVERAKKNVFLGFEEGQLTFPPTYKYQPGTDEYENRPDKKLRVPAWCDRVLWKSISHSRAVEQLFYNRSINLKMSDHKPVIAGFKCDVRKVVKDRVRVVYQELLLQVDKWINASTPKINLEGRVIDLGDITYNQKYRAVMVAHNTGTVMAEWKFVTKNDDTEVCKPWLHLYPRDGILAPDEKAEIEVVVDLSLSDAYDLVTGSAKMVDDIVIFRTIKGNDYFCIISGKVDDSSAETVRQSVIVRDDGLKMVAGEPCNGQNGTAHLSTTGNRGSIFALDDIYREEDSDDEFVANP